MAYKIHNILGPGLLEKVYKHAMCIELNRSSIPFEVEKNFPIYYLEENIGTYFADLVVDNKIILELKSVAEFHPSMESQIINYLRISKLRVGYIINFNHAKVVWIRYVNERD